jgi:hypothetical protein
MAGKLWVRVMTTREEVPMSGNKELVVEGADDLIARMPDTDAQEFIATARQAQELHQEFLTFRGIRMRTQDVTKELSAEGWAVTAAKRLMINAGVTPQTQEALAGQAAGGTGRVTSGST